MKPKYLVALFLVITFYSFPITNGELERTRLGKKLSKRQNLKGTMINIYKFE